MFSRRVAGWQLSTRLRTDLALDALETGLWTRQREDRDPQGLDPPLGPGRPTNISRCTTPSGSRSPARSASVGSTGDGCVWPRRSTPCSLRPRRSTPCSKLSSSATRVRGRTSTTWRSCRRVHRLGSTTDAWTARSAQSRRSCTRTITTVTTASRQSPARQFRDSTEPGTRQYRVRGRQSDHRFCR